MNRFGRFALSCRMICSEKPVNPRSSRGRFFRTHDRHAILEFPHDPPALQGWKHVMPFGAERQRPDPRHRGERQVAIEGGKQRAAARRLPFERRPERLRVDRDQDEFLLAGEMPGGGLAKLVGGRKVDVAVGTVDRRAAEGPVAFGLPPGRALGDLVDEGHGAVPKPVYGGVSSIAHLSPQTKRSGAGKSRAVCAEAFKFVLTSEKFQTRSATKRDGPIGPA